VFKITLPTRIVFKAEGALSLAEKAPLFGAIKNNSFKKFADKALLRFLTCRFL